MQLSTVKHELLNQSCCGRWFPVSENTIVSTDPLKIIIIIIIKKTVFGNFHTVILKMWRRVSIKIQKNNNNGDNRYEIGIKPYKIKDLVALSWR